MAFTFQDFEREMRKKGLQNNFSSADMNLARNDPRAGMSILNYKWDYHNATTPEARAMANKGAERIRNMYGNYTGGKDGGSYYLQNPTPSHYQAPKAPEYKSRYDDRINNLLSRIENRDPFSYNAETDDVYQQYKKQYTREGQRATADTLGTVASATGGIPSSYAVTAASQAGDYYASKLSDKVPELYQAAYDRYLNDYRQQMSTLGALQQAEQSDYNKYVTALNQHNADRAFGYGQHIDNINYQRQKELDALNKAGVFANAGDYGLLKDMGADVSNVPYEREMALKEAAMAAQYGDLRGLEARGIDTTEYKKNLEFQRQMDMARLAAARRSGMGHSGSGRSGSGELTRSQLIQLAKMGADIGDFRYMNELGFDTSFVEKQRNDGLRLLEQQRAQETADEIITKYPNGAFVSPQEYEILLQVYDEDELKKLGFVSRDILSGNGIRTTDNKIGAREALMDAQRAVNTFKNIRKR